MQALECALNADNNSLKTSLRLNGLLTYSVGHGIKICARFVMLCVRSFRNKKL